MEVFNSGVKLISANQQVLIKKLLRCRKLSDEEYKGLRKILDSRVSTSYDASVFIEYVSATIKFRRHFSSKRSKAYKLCQFCNSRDKVNRYWNVPDDKKYWICDFCAISIDPSQIVQVKFEEENQAKAALERKYEYKPEQEAVYGED